MYIHCFKALLKQATVNHLKYGSASKAISSSGNIDLEEYGTLGFNIQKHQKLNCFPSVHPYWGLLNKGG